MRTFLDNSEAPDPKQNSNVVCSIVVKWLRELYFGVASVMRVGYFTESHPLPLATHLQEWDNFLISTNAFPLIFVTDCRSHARRMEDCTGNWHTYGRGMKSM